MKIEELILVDVPAGRFIDLSNLRKKKREIIIGRKTTSSKAHFYLGEELSDVDFQKALKTVSKEHATLSYDGNQVYIQDHSENGIKINDRPLVGEIEILDFKDRIFFGSYGPVVCAARRKL